MQLLTPSDALQAIAHCVKSTRLKSNITIEELAIRSAVGTATLSRIEKRGVCSTDILVRVFAALGMLDRLLDALQTEDGHSIAELRKLHTDKPRQRARKKG